MGNRPLVLAILDGWGSRNGGPGNALARALLPHFSRLQEQYPATFLNASGEEVGLPAGQMGNSEVGHLNIGAGRIVYQELTRISKSIKEGNFFSNPVLLEALSHVRDQNRALHLMGLVSDGGVHSHLEHLYALLEMARKQGLDRVYIHAFLDGRDVAPTSGIDYIRQLESKCRELGTGQIATVMGRFYAMDRDSRWERVARAYQAMVVGQGKKATMAQVAVEQSYEEKVTDEFVVPTVIVDAAGTPKATVQPGDGMVFFNFRADRAREITRSFIEEDFIGFERPGGFPAVNFVCFTQYDLTFDAPVAFPPQNLKNTLGEIISGQGLRQLRIAETEKYAHVTFFFNGGVEEPYPGEKRVLIPSPQVATYNLKPEMSAGKVTDRLLEELARDEFDVVVVNYANPDMVGHTGMLEATVKAVEFVDSCLGRLIEAVLGRNGVLLVTADHGNCEQMVDPETGEPYTAHTCDLVPLILVAEKYRHLKLARGALRDIAPTMLDILDIEQPAEMTGRSLIHGRQNTVIRLGN
ncbi:MAG TPA: 2,3-bisphosphoglycerate-independent phosphoglycerate mutase [Clostridia bacterium]|jgi:2,3-bisphosphoglycerate-independent phosphoglycerate mutase|nr:2,3-bisphosphoglycerate-independent phosphoglycerate mutase [Clostridia bacterium]